MEAIIKSTGEKVNLGDFVVDVNGREIWFEDIEFQTDYWDRLEHTYAGMAMQGILSNPESELDYTDDETLPQAIAGCVAKVAHALVEKMKENEKAMH